MKLKTVFGVLARVSIGIGILLLLAWLMNVASLISWGNAIVQALVGIAFIILGVALRRRGR
jgi:hypothetical protein